MPTGIYKPSPMMWLFTLLLMNGEFLGNRGRATILGFACPLFMFTYYNISVYDLRKANNIPVCTIIIIFNF